MFLKHLFLSLICLFLLLNSIFSQQLIVDTTFTPAINGYVDFVEILNDGKILVVGNFTVVNGVTRNRMARLNQDGTLDTSFNANNAIIVNGSLNATIRAMEVLPDGKILIGGYLPYNNQIGERVLRLNTDGSFDATQTSVPEVAQGQSLKDIYDVDELSDGKILVCGRFTTPNGNNQPYIARYNHDGSFDSTFTTQINSWCRNLELQPDGKYFIAGTYTTVNGSSKIGLTRFNTDDSVDLSFNAQPVPVNSPTFYDRVMSQNDGTIITSRGAGYGYVSHLDANGNHLETYDTRISRIGDIEKQPNEKPIVVAEYDSGYSFGMSRDFNRFNRDGTYDPSLDRLSTSGGVSGSSPVKARAVEVFDDGKVILGGNFNSIQQNSNEFVQPNLVRFVPQEIPIKPKFDFDGDGKDDIAVYRPSDTLWYLNQSSAGFSVIQFGIPTDRPIATDYDGDDRADIAVFRDGIWYWLRSSDNVFSYQVSGQAGDIPQPGNYSLGSNEKYLMFFRPTEAKFYYQRPFGSPGEWDMRMPLLSTDKPVTADYDGDGKTDLAVYRDGNWFVLQSGRLAIRHYQFGLPTDKPVIGDFDGDLRTDFAVFRPSDGVWYIHKSSEGFYAVQWGLADDLPVPADYDGDGKTDIAVYRPSDGVWYKLLSTNSYQFDKFGVSGDIPIPLR